MKRNVLNGIAALLVSASAAYAADMSVPPPAPPVPVNSWTGFYFDVALGWQQNAYNWTWNNPAALAAGAGAVGMPSTNGGSIGGHIGYQQQFGWLLAGVEIGGANSTNAPWSTSVPSVGVLPCGLATLACSATVGAISTFGGKLGVVWQDYLVYGVGGAAFASNLSGKDVFPSGVAFDLWAPQSARGWYAGGGIDVMLFKTKLLDFIGGVEYEHINLGAVQTCGVATGCAASAMLLSAKEDIVWAKFTVKWNPLGM